jgi:hypothetical protein
MIKLSIIPGSVVVRDEFASLARRYGRDVGLGSG